MSSEQLIQIAKTANQCERYQDMSDSICEIIVRGPNQSINMTEVHNMLTIAFKNTITHHREAIQSIWRIIIQENENIKWEENCLNYMKHINHEKNVVCQEFVKSLKRAVEKVQVTDHYSLSFYWKSIGDYYRYMCEPFKKVEFDLTLRDVDQKELVNYLTFATDAYTKAIEFSTHLKKEHPIFCGIRLNYSVFVHDYLQDIDKAIKIVNDTLAECDNDQDIKGKEGEELNSILKIMKENIKLWNNGDNNFDID